MNDTIEDEILAHQARHNRDAFATLYRRYLHRVYSYLLSRVANPQDAEDLTTQTFIAALESIEQYQNQGKFSAWLIGIARHKAADHFRRKSNDLPLDIVDLTQVAPSPELQVIRSLDMQSIVHALEKINPDRAEALRLRIFGELSMAEIGQVMNKSESSAKMLVYRALDDLRAFFNLNDNKEIISHESQ